MRCDRYLTPSATKAAWQWLRVLQSWDTAVQFRDRVAEADPEHSPGDADRVPVVHDDGRAGERSFAEVLVEQSSEALIALSSDGAILSWNRAAERIYGHSRQA